MGNDYGIDLIITTGATGTHLVKAPGLSAEPGDLVLFEDENGKKLSEQAVVVMTCPMTAPERLIAAVQAYGSQPMAVSGIYRKSWVKE